MFPLYGKRPGDSLVREVQKLPLLRVRSQGAKSDIVRSENAIEVIGDRALPSWRDMKKNAFR
jgi:hypothetical protein